ncbi:MAG: hypothetical protein ACYS7Y_11815 [Planctomycetota bacterium]|jgi:hypothetical protein
MFAFAAQDGDEVVFVQTSKGHVYTFPTEKLAREYFGPVKHATNIYQLEMDLSIARLIEAGDNIGSAPAEFEPTEDQKHGLWASYVYKSMLEWAPYPEDVR